MTTEKNVTCSIVMPSDLWRQFKGKCALEGKTIRGKLIELITNYINGGVHTN